MRKLYILLVLIWGTAALLTAHNVVKRVHTAGEGLTFPNALAPAGSNLPETLITDTPDGRQFKAYSGAAHGYFLYGDGRLYVNDADAYVVDLVEGSDGAFYIHNPFSTYITNSWVKGDIVRGTAGRPDTIVVNLPQKVMEVDDGNDGLQSLYAQKLHLKLTEGQKPDYGVAVGDNKVRFTWDGDTLRMLGHDVFAMTYADSSWTGFGDDSIVISKIKDEAAVPPATLKTSNYIMSYQLTKEEKDTAYVKAGRDGDNLYVGGLIPDNDCWIKGTVDGNRLTFGEQYLGPDYKSGYHRYFVPVQTDSIWDEDNYDWIVKTTPTGRLEYDYRPADSTFSTTGTFLLNRGKKQMWVDFNYDHFQYSATAFSPLSAAPMQPQAPVIDYFSDYDDVNKYGIISFIIPTTDAGGKLLDPSQLYYRLYFDDQLFTFQPAEYKSLKEPLTDVPYDYNDMNDFMILEGSRTVSFYFGGYDKVGVQSVYKGGVTHESAINWHASSGIEGVPSAGAAATPVSVTYTDLSGRIVAHPAKGLYIQTVRTADGVVTSRKVVR